MKDLTNDINKKNKLSERPTMYDYTNYIKGVIDNAHSRFPWGAKAAIQVAPFTGMHRHSP